jgi:hypothetical protein
MIKKPRPIPFYKKDLVPKALIESLCEALKLSNLGYAYSDLEFVKINNEDGQRHTSLTVEQAGFYLNHLVKCHGLGQRPKSVEDWLKKVSRHTKGAANARNQ